MPNDKIRLRGYERIISDDGNITLKSHWCLHTNASREWKLHALQADRISMPVSVWSQRNVAIITDDALITSLSGQNTYFNPRHVVLLHLFHLLFNACIQLMFEFQRLHMIHITIIVMEIPVREK